MFEHGLTASVIVWRPSKNVELSGVTTPSKFAPNSDDKIINAVTLIVASYVPGIAGESKASTKELPVYLRIGVDDASGGLQTIIMPKTAAVDMKQKYLVTSV